MNIPIQLKNNRFLRVRFKDKRPFEDQWQKKPYTYEEIQQYFPKENYGVICGKELRALDDDTPKQGLIKLYNQNFPETMQVRGHVYFKFDNGNEDKIIFENKQLLFPDSNGKLSPHMGELQGEGTMVVGVGCYDDKTEMLTIDGFKGMNEISINDKIATVNKKGILEYHNPIRMFRDKYIGDMVDIKSRSIDLFITPNHRVYFKKDYTSKKFKFDSAENLIGKQIRLKRNASWEGKERRFIKLPSPKPIFRKNTQRSKAYNLRESGKSYKDISKIMNLQIDTVRDYVYKRKKLGVKRIDTTNELGNIKVDTFLKFLGWWISEGSISMPDYSISITQSETRYYNEIKNMLDDLGIKYNYNKGCMSFRFNSKQIYQYIKPLRGSHNKYIPKWVKNLSVRQINIFLDSLFKGDGSFKNGELRKYYTVSKRLSDDVVELLLKTGRNSTINLSKRTLTPPSGIECYTECFVISICKSKLSRTNNIKKRKYDGEIWCVEVPNNTVFVKRNGKTCWCGNSTHPSGEKYELIKDLPIVTISYSKFKEVFGEYFKEKKQQIIRDHKPSNWKGDNIIDIPIGNIISFDGLRYVGNHCLQGTHPKHGSGNGMNFRIDTLNNTWTCFRCNNKDSRGCGGPSELIAVMEDIRQCDEVGAKCFTDDQARQVIKVAREKYGLSIPEIQTKALGEVRGWANSVSIIRLAKKHNFENCHICDNPFKFQDSHGMYYCKTCKYGGGLNKLAKLISKRNRGVK